jgi:CRISPR/Cas system-associated protein endoribonuclease Cas2
MSKLQEYIKQKAPVIMEKKKNSEIRAFKRDRKIKNLIKKGYFRGLENHDFFKKIVKIYTDTNYLNDKLVDHLQILVHGSLRGKNDYCKIVFTRNYEQDLKLVSYYDMLVLNDRDRKAYQSIVNFLLEKKKLSADQRAIVDQLNRKYKAY